MKFLLVVFLMCMLMYISPLSAAETETLAAAEVGVFSRLDAAHFAEYMRSLLSEEELVALEESLDSEEDAEEEDASLVEVDAKAGVAQDSDKCKEIMTSWVGKCVFSV